MGDGRIVAALSHAGLYSAVWVSSACLEALGLQRKPELQLVGRQGRKVPAVPRAHASEWVPESALCRCKDCSSCCAQV